MELTRRTLLAGAGAGAALAVTSPALAGPGAIDIHAHVIPDFYRRALRRNKVRRLSGVRIPDWSPERALRFMNRHGIAAQVVSLPDPSVTFVKDAGGREQLARRINDYVAKELVNTHLPQRRGRFGGLVTLPLRDCTPADVERAIAEAKRGLVELGLDGVSLLSNYGEVYLGDDRLVPLLKYLNSQGALVVVHPNRRGTKPRTSLPNAMLEAPFNSTRSIVHLSYQNRFKSLAGIRWLFTDGGGALPYLAYRTSLLQLTSGILQNIGVSVLDADNQSLDHGKLLWDTANASAPASLRPALQVGKASNVLFGTDWPLSGRTLPRTGKAQPSLIKVLNAADLQAVERANALRELPRLKARMG